MKHAIKYQWLDFLRGACALLVCAGHLRAAMFTDYATLASSSIFTKFFYLATGFGHQAVVVFFVLSGFFVGGSVLRSRENFKFLDYILSRLARLWVVLIPALVVTFVVDRMINGINPGVLLGSDFAHINSGPNGQYSDSITTLFNNLIFLQTINAPVFGSNGPLWSLSNEFWYYMAFPLMFFLLQKAQVRSKAIFVIALALILIFPMQNKVGGFVAWLMGVAVNATSASKGAPKSVLAQGVAIFTATAVFILSKANVWGFSEQLDTVVLGAGASLLILALCNTARMPALMAPTADAFARISYTLYMVHFPLVILIYSAFYAGKQLQPGAEGYLQYAGILICIILFSYGMWFLFERRTDQVKRWALNLGQKFHGKITQS